MEEAHLFVVLIDTTLDSDRTILVPFCTISEDRYYDGTVTIQPGEHDFVTAPTYISYYDARVVSQLQLDTMIQQRIARRRNPAISNDLLQRIRDGIRDSEDTPTFVDSYYLDYLFGL